MTLGCPPPCPAICPSPSLPQPTTLPSRLRTRMWWLLECRYAATLSLSLPEFTRTESTGHTRRSETGGTKRSSACRQGTGQFRAFVVGALLRFRSGRSLTRNVRFDEGARACSCYLRASSPQAATPTVSTSNKHSVRSGCEHTNARLLPKGSAGRPERSYPAVNTRPSALSTMELRLPAPTMTLSVPRDSSCVCVFKSYSPEH